MPPDELRHLHFINALFAPLTGRDLYLAQQIKSAIALSLDDTLDRPMADGDFTRAAVALFERLVGGRPGNGFYHWDAASLSEGEPPPQGAGPSDTAGLPLFARAELMRGLKRLAPYREATLLVTHLRAAQQGTRLRWTHRLQRDYDETLSYLRALAAARTARSAELHLLFL